MTAGSLGLSFVLRLFASRVLVTVTITSLTTNGVWAESQKSPSMPITVEKWASVSSASQGTKLRIKLTTGTEIEGRLVGRMEPESLVLRDIKVLSGRLSVPGSGETVMLSRSDIHSLDNERRHDGWKQLAIWSSVLLGTLIAVFIASGDYSQ